jgi:MscS family membrane protein
MDFQPVKNLEDFWALVVDVWQHGLFGVDIGEVLIALAIFIVFLIFRRLFARFILARLSRWTARTETNLDDEVLNALEPPLAFVPVVMGFFFATAYLHPKEPLADFISNLNRSLVSFAIFWALYKAVGPLSRVVGKLEELLSPSMVQWLIKAVRIGLLVIGGAVILEVWGIQVGPLIAGLGLFGVAVALGAQDLFKNLIAGLFVIGERRFHIGDWIHVDGVVEGTVESIGFRTTRIRRFDKAPVFVPNSQLSDNAVTNFSHMTHRRIYWIIGVEYRTTTEQLRRIRDGIEAYITSSDDFASPDEVSTFVRIDKFAASSIDIMLYCFTKSTVWGEWLEIKERLACEIKRIVEEAGAGFAFPSQSIYVESLPGTPETPGVEPEPFPMPKEA